MLRGRAVVAIKGLGRFSELDSAAARERFIIGTLVSMIWAGLCAALILLTPFYALQGLAVLRHFCLRVGVPRPLQVLGFGLLVLQPPLLFLGSAGLGLADLWVDFRKIRGTPAST